MIANDPNCPDKSTESPESPNFTLEPLRTQGRDALSTFDIPAFAKITLRQLEITWENSNNQISIKKGDDLFCSTCPNPIPPAGEITRATFRIQPKAGDGPLTVEIVPPHTISIHPPHDATTIYLWLNKHGFKMPPAAAAILLLIAIAAAALPFPDTDDDNDDDTVDHHRHALTVRC